MRIQRVPIVAAILVSTTLFSIGCGGANGVTTGASTQTTVAVKRDQSASGSQDASKKADDQAGGPVAEGGFGTLKGRVAFKGTAPALRDLIEKGQKVPDAICSAQAIPNETLVVNGDGVANVVVFLPKTPPGVAIPPPPSEPAVFDQKGCHFIPHVLLMRAGQPVKVRNSDFPVAHNTHTLPQKSVAFNETIPKEGKEFVYKRSETEPCEVKCDIHAWMRAYHFPLDHPYAAVSGANGEFEIKNVPAGKHTFRVWHEGATGRYLNRNLSVAIKPGETATIEINYDAASFGN